MRWKKRTKWALTKKHNLLCRNRLQTISHFYIAHFLFFKLLIAYQTKTICLYFEILNGSNKNNSSSYKYSLEANIISVYIWSKLRNRPNQTDFLFFQLSIFFHFSKSLFPATSSTSLRSSLKYSQESHNNLYWVYPKTSPWCYVLNTFLETIQKAKQKKKCSYHFNWLFWYRGIVTLLQVLSEWTSSLPFPWGFSQCPINLCL